MAQADSLTFEDACVGFVYPSSWGTPIAVEGDIYLIASGRQQIIELEGDEVTFILTMIRSDTPNQANRLLSTNDLEFSLGYYVGIAMATQYTSLRNAQIEVGEYLTSDIELENNLAVEIIIDETHHFFQIIEVTDDLRFFITFSTSASNLENVEDDFETLLASLSYLGCQE